MGVAEVSSSTLVHLDTHTTNLNPHSSQCQIHPSPISAIFSSVASSRVSHMSVAMIATASRCATTLAESRTRCLLLDPFASRNRDRCRRAIATAQRQIQEDIRVPAACVRNQVLVPTL